jgi:hypothetical protein
VPNVLVLKCAPKTFASPPPKLFPPKTFFLRPKHPKNLAKKFAFFTQNKAKLYKNVIITLVFEKDANLFAKNCRKSQKIVIITSTPDLF